MTQLVIGWGNPIAGDDAVGHRAAELIAQHASDDIHVRTTSFGGLRLVESMRGYSRVIVADVRLDDGDPGLHIDVYHPQQMTLEDRSVRHDGTLADALRVFSHLQDAELPNEITVISVPISAPRDWSSELSPSGESAARSLADAVLQELEVTAVV